MRLLADRGWPKAGLVELLSPRIGIGELRLLGPALAAFSVQEQRWITWINPPHIPYAPALAELGIDIGKVLLVHPKTHADALWALEQAVKSGTCSAALAWLDESKLATKDVRRLKLAARRGETLTVLFRPDTAAQRQSMAELRILLQPRTCVGSIEHRNTEASRRLADRTAGARTQLSHHTRDAPRTARTVDVVADKKFAVRCASPTSAAPARSASGSCRRP